MKIAVKDLEPNPYRRMDKYPIDRVKVEQLKTSIKEKTFWDNILARSNGNGKYQLAYGHHRWIALKELGIKQIDIPIRKIDEADMIKIMAEENLNWSTSPTVMVQTILVAKEFLDAELAKYKTFATSPEIWRCLFKSQTGFAEARTKGIGEPTLTKFLGGNWTKHKVGVALNIIKDKELSEQAIEIIPTMEQAKVFRIAVKEHKISKPIQKKIAKKIITDGIGKRDIPDLVEEFSTLCVKKEIRKPKKVPNLIEFLNKREAEVDKLNYHLTALKPELKELVKNPRVLGRLVSTLKRLDKTMGKIIAEYETQKMRKESEICV